MLGRSIIHRYYGDKVAKRTGVPLINHITEGIKILNELNASIPAIEAYCVHPIFQGDDDLLDNVMGEGLITKKSMSGAPLLSDVRDLHVRVIINAMEYRSVANEYLSKRKIRSIKSIRLSPLEDVNMMLIADKVQNRKDFDLYHKGTHPRSEELTEYFNNWLERLGVSEEKYQELIGLL
jgi:hypothetical protein